MASWTRAQFAAHRVKGEGFLARFPSTAKKFLGFRLFFGISNVTLANVGILDYYVCYCHPACAGV